jgi:WD40 repeat protein
VTGVLWARARAAALRAEASKLIALGRAELDRYPTAAVAYARKSLEVTDTAEGRRFAVDALWRSPTARVLPLGEEVVWRADFSPDGRWLAGFPFSGRILLFGDDGGPPRVVQGQPPTASVPRIHFTPTGDAVLAQSLEEARVHMYGVPDGRELRRFEPEPPGGYGVIPRPIPGRSNFHPMWTPLPQGLLFQWAPVPVGATTLPAPAPGMREPFGIWPYDGGPPSLVGSLRYPAWAWAVDARGSHFLLRRGPRLVLRPLVGGSDDTLGTPVVTLGENDPIGEHGFDSRGEKVWVRDTAAGAPRLRLWSLGPSASPEPRVLSLPNPEPGFSPVWDPTGSGVAWGSSAEHAVWLWDLAGPPDAAPSVFRRPDTANTFQGLFSPRGGWLAVTNHDTLTFWPLDQPRARVLGGHANVVNRLAFTADSESLLSCGSDSVRLWPLHARTGGMRKIAAGYRGMCYDAGLSPEGGRLALVGSYGVWLTSSIEGEGRWLLENARRALWAPAWEGNGGRLAVASGYTADEPNVVLLFDLGAGTQRSFSLVPPGENGRGFDWGVYSLAFTPEGRLLAGGNGGVRWIDLETGASDWVWRLPKDVTARFALSADARLLAVAGFPAAQGQKAGARSEVLLVDLVRGGRRSVASHGDTVLSVAMDAAGRTLVTGDEQGVVRVGLADGSEPHRLCCHAGIVSTVAVSSDGKWIASAAGGEIRLWPMPDVSKPPLHTLPYDQLMTKLRALTNLQVVEDAASPTGYKLDIGPFPGWKDVPTW